MTLESFFDMVSTLTAQAMGRPVTFIASFLLVLVWALAGPVFHFSDSWQLVVNTVSSIVTFLMVFLIQNTTNREGDEIQAKLDRLVRALEAADSRYVGLEARVGQEADEVRTPLGPETGPGGLTSEPLEDKPRSGSATPA